MAVTVNVAIEPAVTATLTGFCVIAGAVAVVPVVPPPLLPPPLLLLALVLLEPPPPHAPSVSIPPSSASVVRWGVRLKTGPVLTD